MIRKRIPLSHDPTGGYRFSVATNAERACAKVMLKQRGQIMIRFGRIIISSLANPRRS